MMNGKKSVVKDCKGFNYLSLIVNYIFQIIK
jgi:hypothetical protein